MSFFRGLTLNSPVDNVSRCPSYRSTALAAEVNVLTVLAVDVNFQVQILILSSASRALAAAPVLLLAQHIDIIDPTHSLRLMSISRVSLTWRGGDGGAGAGGGVGERALSTPVIGLANDCSYVLTSNLP